MKEGKIVLISTTVEPEKVKQVKQRGLLKTLDVFEYTAVAEEMNAYLREGYRIVNIQTNPGYTPTQFYVYLERDI